MHNFLSITFFLMTLAVISPIEAQPPKTGFGPVVSSYLNGLNEELRELEFQVSHQEISRADYALTRERLRLLRGLVERRATSSREDRVPEVQVLTAAEFGRLGLSARPDAAKLRVGTVLEKQWKLTGLEHDQKTGRKFFVFEKTGAQQKPGKVDEEPMMTLPVRKISVAPESVIETITVPEDEFWLLQRAKVSDEETAVPPQAHQAVPEAATPAPAPVSAAPAHTVTRPATPVADSQPPATVATKPVAATVVPATAAPAPAAPATPAAERAAAVPAPQIITLYTPTYTVEARGDNIEGEVIISALFCQDGWIREIEVVKGLGHGLDDRAVAAIKKTMFEPARQNNKSIDARAQVLYRFTLDKVTAEVVHPGQAAKGTQP